MVPLTRRSRRARRPIVYYTYADTDLGRLIMAATDAGVCYLSIGEDDDELAADLQANIRAQEYKQVGGAALAVGPYLSQVLRFLQGEAERLDMPLDIQGTSFQQDVWRVLSEVPYGQTIYYGDIAETLGRPQSVRSVAQACSANPVALVVPCHRAIAKRGLGGYGLGVDRKKALLSLEQRVAAG